jgi:tetratricopeptide (TPR) repeat protein
MPGFEQTAHTSSEALGSDAPGRGPSRRPSADMLEEIENYLIAGSAAEAGRQVKNLRALGYESPELDALALRAEQTFAPTAVPAAVTPSHTPSHTKAAAASPPASGTFSLRSDLADDLDLKAITDALEEDLLAELGAAPPIVAPEAPDQSLDEIFAAFKQQVQAEVQDEDYKTHYDLGIAYKEMGLVDEAILEFEHVTRNEGLYRQACSMIAMCQLDRGDLPQAARWFRAALDASGDDIESRIGLTYDLASVLLESGDAEGALDLFRGVQSMQPGYRDVQRHVSQIESKLTP